MLIKELRSIVGHCSNMGDSSPLTCSETSLFPFEALFVHLVNKEPLEFWGFFCLVFRRLRKTTPFSDAKGWLDQPPWESTQVCNQTGCNC